MENKLYRLVFLTAIIFFAVGVQAQRRNARYVEYINKYIIKFNKTNLSIMEPHKIIISNNKATLIGLLYEDIEKIYLPREKDIISFTKYISILNTMNKN